MRPSLQERKRNMFELITVLVFLWLLFKGIGLALRLTWGAAKVIATILMVLASPLLVLCLLFAGGVALLIPIVVIGLAVGILKACL